MRIAERSFDLTAKDRHGFIEKGLTYGNLEPQYADRILNSAYNMTRQAVQHYTNRFVDIEKSLFSMPKPPATEQMVGFINDLLGSYPVSLHFPQVCDLILFEVFTKRKEAKGWLRLIFPQSDLALRVEAVGKFLGMLVSIGACPPDLLEIAFAPVRSVERAEDKQTASVAVLAQSPAVGNNAGASSDPTTAALADTASAEGNKPAAASHDDTEHR